MNAQSFFATIERHFQKAEYISIRHLGFKMLSAPKALEQENVRLFTFLSNGQKANAKLLEELADYAKSVAFYKNCKDGQKVYAFCIFAADDFSTSQSELFNKIKTHNGVTVISAGYSLADGKITVCSRAGALASAQTKKILKLAQEILK